MLIAKLDVGVDHVHEVTGHAVLGKPLAVVYAENLHALVVREVWKQLGRNEEILAAIGFAGDLDEGVVYGAFGAAVHTL